jgi:hypothetical protein
MALVSTQPLTEMSTRNLPGGKGRVAREADTICLYAYQSVCHVYPSYRY